MTDLPTAAGPEAVPASSGRDPELMDAINQIFSLFEINYHHQFFSAFSNDPEKLIEVKRLWYGSLKRFPPRTLLSAVKQIVEQEQYLPTLYKMIEFCSAFENKAPSAHQAYVEACGAPSPKAAFSWSHPAVYWAGKRANWFFLSTTAEQFAFPVFRDHYRRVLEQIATRPELEQLPEPDSPTAGKSKEEKGIERTEGLKRARALRKNLGI